METSLKSKQDDRNLEHAEMHPFMLNCSLLLSECYLTEAAHPAVPICLTLYN